MDMKVDSSADAEKIINTFEQTGFVFSQSERPEFVNFIKTYLEWYYVSGKTFEYDLIFKEFDNQLNNHF